MGHELVLPEGAWRDVKFTWEAASTRLVEWPKPSFPSTSALCFSGPGSFSLTSVRPAPQVVDKFNDLLVSAYVTGGHTRLLMLHEARTPEHGIIQFFSEVHELYVKVRKGGRFGACRRLSSMRHPRSLRG